jgi:HD superfamily phosphodiesterase
MPVLQLTTIKDTSLWNLLNEGFSGAEEELAKRIALYLIDICQTAYDRMKGFASLHPEYTLHDAVHCLRVTELMYRIIPSTTISHLNPVEIALLILSAHFHDQGMVLGKEEIKALHSKVEFKVFEDNWKIEHPNLKDVEQRLTNKNIIGAELNKIRETYYELRAAMLTDYVRLTHGERSAQIVKNNYSDDPRWSISETNLAESVARLCASHVNSAFELTPMKGFRYDEVIGTYRVNMPYIGLILRLADILDFDRDRTPYSLYRTIDFRSQVSLKEWEKHRSVNGWVIEPTLIQFTMQCEHPEYQRAAYQYMDWIDKELADAYEVLRLFPAEFSAFRLELPLKVDRSRIEPKDQAYIYFDLEFSLSRDEIVKLLMTDRLYGSPSLCIRELLQNALDALRHRKALIKRDNETEWQSGKVIMEHVVDEQGHEVIRCIDNGAGMDKSIIERFLTKAGRSYYRSPEFEQERISFREQGIDFDPCAQFGIGFMSCFMIGDRIKLYTRRDLGPSRGMGEPLIVEINGLGGMIVVRQGDASQSVGTTVEVTGWKKPRGFERWQDKVHLIDMLNGYALACEFPIEGHCKLPEIAESISIPPEIAFRLTPLERTELTNYVTLEQSFSEIHPLLNGNLRVSLLINESGIYTIENSEAYWKPPVDESSNRSSSLWDIENREIDKHDHNYGDQTCIDGILVGGEARRDRRENLFGLGGYANPISLGRPRFVLDIRGQIKPPLTPARHPPDSARDPFRRNPRWMYIQSLASQAKGRLWEQVAEQMASELNAETFWQLAIINDGYSAGIHWMRAEVIWSLIAVPLLDSDGIVEWRNISALGRVEPISLGQKNGKEEFYLSCSDGKRISAYEALTKWYNKQYSTIANWDIQSLIICMSTVVIGDGQAKLELQYPTKPDVSPWLSVLTSRDNNVYALPYSGEARQFLSVYLLFRNANQYHPLVREALSAKYLEQKSELQEFADTAVRCLSAPETAEILSGANPKIGRWQRQVGYLYENVDWHSVPQELSPPYKIRMKNGQCIEVTGKDFIYWANAEVNLDE